MISVHPIRVTNNPHIYPIDRWSDILRFFPDQSIASWILDGLKNVFRVGLTGPQPKVKSRNLPTTSEEKLAVSRWVLRGLNQGYTIGPFQKPPFPNAVISPVGAVQQTNKIRPIFHLSAPKRSKTSVNDSIHPSLRTVSYIKFIQIVRFANQLGTQGYLWVADMQDAYMHVMVHPHDWAYLGFQWCSLYFFLTCLPFGLSSS